MFERAWRELSFLPRWTIVRTIRQQSVAEHSYYVAVYSAQIAYIMEMPSKLTGLLLYALAHDLPEFETGDLQSPFKRMLLSAVGPGALKEIEEKITANVELVDQWLEDVDPMTLRIVKAADCLDAAMFICTELQMGNGSLGDIFAAMDNARYNSMTETDHVPARPVAHRIIARLWEAWRALTPDSVDFSIKTWIEYVEPALIQARSGITERVL